MPSGFWQQLCAGQILVGCYGRRMSGDGFSWHVPTLVSHEWMVFSISLYGHLGKGGLMAFHESPARLDGIVDASRRCHAIMPHARGVGGVVFVGGERRGAWRRG
ncbi:hypothetical protein HMPREF1640_11915 [Prevotella sp. S7-1-8]|uniref:hypothetical protein n=1 Tax=Prevotella sp. S7-1-8 TaxID=1284775 RepID=UPI00050E35A2|nr:hypothetical protein [Prevotella sp. S7-1-8]KGF15708.1 hypothetical protein HMPREF1640_11915 [Prevotella sp. S7-1-8]